MAAPRIPITDLPEQTTPVDTDLLVVQNGPTTKKMTVGRLSTQATTALADHIADPTGAHAASAISAIPNTAPLSGTDVQTQLAQASAGIVAVQGEVDAAESALIAHSVDTTGIHGIADTSVLETVTGSQAKVNTHAVDTTAVHGIADTTVLETVTGSQAKVDLHANGTTNVHGIVNTAVLETQSGSQAKVDAHTSSPTAHAAGAITFTPTGTIAATNVQAAIAEVAAEAGVGGGGITTEDAVDATAAAFAAGTHTNVTVTYDDTANSISLAASGSGTIADDSVTNAKLAEVATGTFKGNNTGNPGNPVDMTTLQAKVLLQIDNVNNTGDSMKPVSTPQQTALDLKENKAQTIEAVAGTTYTVGSTDASKIKRLAATATITLPSAGLALGQRVDFVCVGGPATFALGGGATWDVAPTPSAVARAIGSVVTAIKMTATAWALTGDLA